MPEGYAETHLLSNKKSHLYARKLSKRDDDWETYEQRIKIINQQVF